MKRGFKVGLAFGGGGARGFAHIGVIKVLKAHSISIDLITGTSMGAIIGASFCLEPDINVVEKKFLEIINDPEIKRLESFFAQASEDSHPNLIIKKLLSKIKNLYLWNLQVAKRWLIRSEPITKVLEKIFDNRKFSDLKIPFACIAVDLNSGYEVVIKEGRLLDAILASSSIPGVFAPLKCDNQLLADGGILSSVPARQARFLGADFVIGVDLDSGLSKKELLTGLDVIHQADGVRTQYLNKLNLRYCDLVIRPEVANVSWSAFSRAPFCIQQGVSETSRYVEAIKQALVRKKRFHFLRRLFSKGLFSKGGKYVD